MTAAPTATPSAAATEAAARGQVCIFLAPNDVDPAGPRPPLGHNGWGFRHGASSSWTYGATEGMTGRPQATFIRTGSGRQMMHNFKTRRTGKWRYAKYRCIATASAYPARAMQAALAGRNSGYDFFRNNCLTKSVDVFRAYSPWLSASGHLPNARYRNTSWPPNYYYNTLLSKAGWSRSHNL
ncbi:hypothetical protein [Streptomyces sp. V4I8]|uniref:hypothetical protein n=1 Tax=Streptomyces sp. V4I8 TaxID=3156469 RepID=UPI003513C166